jgi:hypothetical protein
MRQNMTKKKTTQKVRKPKAVRVVYVERREDDSPFATVNKAVGAGVGAIIGIGVAGAIAKAFK